MDKSIFPHIKKSIENFVSDQEGNIPRNKVLTIGSMMLILSVLLADQAFAGHTSHRSHSSHSSHRSHSNSGHYSHSSHSSHSSHTSSSTHSNHSNSHSSHSNSTTHVSHSSGTTGDTGAGTREIPTHSNAAPALSDLNSIKSPALDDSLALGSKIGLAAATNSTPPDTTAVADETALLTPKE